MNVGVLCFVLICVVAASPARDTEDHHNDESVIPKNVPHQPRVSNDTTLEDDLGFFIDYEYDPELHSEDDKSTGEIGCSDQQRYDIEMSCFDVFHEAVSKSAFRIDQRERDRLFCCAMEDFENCCIQEYAQSGCPQNTTKERFQEGRMSLSRVANISCTKDECSSNSLSSNSPSSNSVFSLTVTLSPLLFYLLM